jgi:hypothetical protein
MRSEMGSTSGLKKVLWIAGAALTAALAWWGEKPATAVSATLLSALVGWRIQGQEKRAAAAPEDEGTALQRHLLQDELKKAMEKLGVPAQFAVVARWNQFHAQAAQLMGEKLALDEKRLSELVPEQGTRLAQHAAREAVGRLENWMPGRELFLSTAVPAGILYSTSQLSFLTPLAFILGTVATTFAAPLLLRLAALVRAWRAQAQNGMPFNQYVTPHLRALIRAGIEGSKIRDDLSTGSWVRATAIGVINGLVDTARTTTDDDQGHKAVALAATELAASFDPLEIDSLWADELQVQLKKYCNHESYEAIRECLPKMVRRHHQRLEVLEQHLSRLLGFEPEPVAASA